MNSCFPKAKLKAKLYNISKTFWEACCPAIKRTLPITLISPSIMVLWGWSKIALQVLNLALAFFSEFLKKRLEGNWKLNNHQMKTSPLFRKSMNETHTHAHAQ